MRPEDFLPGDEPFASLHHVRRRWAPRSTLLAVHEQGADPHQRVLVLRRD